jgi:tRNA1(Val) A37 N6-methylase TrmN6
VDRTVTEGARAIATIDQPTDDAFLGGALKILQPRSGYRAGLDAVMLAAAVPASDGRPMRVLDVGAGVGTAGLCLARRVAAAEVMLFEREPALVRMAEENVARNGLSPRVRVVQGEVGVSAAALSALGIAEESFDHVMANPPFHASDAGTLPPDAMKAGAHAMPEAELAHWARFMARMAAPAGRVTVIHKAEALGRLLAVLEGRFGALTVLPLHPRADAPAHRVLVQGIKGSRAPLSLLPGFILHDAGDAFTPEAQAILRDGAALTMTSESGH